MKLFILGATGGTGRELVEQGLARGHTITALVRSPEKLTPCEKLTIIPGDPRNTADLRRTLPGHDAVLTALGGGIGRSTICADAARSTVAAMKATGVRRLVAVSAAVLFRNEGLVVWIARGTFLRNVVADCGAMDAIFSGSDLDWTIVRPPRLTNDAPSGKYTLANGHLPPGRRVVSRADVAHLVLDELERETHLRTILGMTG